MFFKIKNKKKRIFILGVGMEKAGTTWIYEYLRSFQDFVPGFAKECHIWDSIFYEKIVNKPLQRIIAQSKEFLKQNPSSWEKKFSKNYVNNFLRIYFINNPAKYFEYFDLLTCKTNSHFSADITPPYSGLSKNQFSYIKNNFENRGILVKPVLLLRDPVKRLKSNINMYLRNNKIEKISKEEEKEKMFKLINSKQYEIRNNYEYTINNLDHVFKDNYFVGFYENIFSNTKIKELCNYLNVDFIKPNFKQKVNSSKNINNFTLNDYQEIRSVIINQYNFCQKKFGKEFIDELWKF